MAAGSRMIPVAKTAAQPTVTTMVSCKTCDRFFANTANMHQHARHCSGPQPASKMRKDLKCPVCNMVGVILLTKTSILLVKLQGTTIS